MPPWKTDGVMLLKIEKISQKQLQVLTWWCDHSPYSKKDAIICDGAVRSGKTLFMSLSFVIWAMENFSGQRFGMCGKTIGALRRNVVLPLLPVLKELGFLCSEKLSRNMLTVSNGNQSNEFYLFGGKDEGSAALVQGVTFAGVLFDEVALQPRSFVQQACARCSVEGSRFWFNCNPEGPFHWFYLEWIKKCDERNALYLHFTMRDNPSLSQEIIERYEHLYSGVFYRRFILGKWIAAEGKIYDFFDESYIETNPPEEFEEYYLSCDYGTRNPASFGMWGLADGVWYRIKEYYFSSRKEGYQKTDAEYINDLIGFCHCRKIKGVVVDPSAASFIEALRREGFRVIKAQNDVLSGIRTTANLLKQRKIVICSACTDAIREFSEYVWDTGKSDDTPKKENDHAMDDIRYFACTIAVGEDDLFAATFVER